MKIQDLHQASGFIVFDVSLNRLCKYLTQLPGVTFTFRRRFFLSASDERADFSFSNHTFRIKPELEDDGIRITQIDDETGLSEIGKIKQHLTTFTNY